MHTLLKSSHGEEYLSKFRFVVFERNDIDLNEMFQEGQQLSQFRNSFTVVPPIEQISSTEVRRRFYEDKDFSALVPDETVEVMRKYKPLDFSVSFEDRMKVMMGSGRFGRQNTRKEIYKLNTQLFHAWQNGTADIDLGDYKAFLDGTKHYKKPFDVSDMGEIYDSTITS